jgi:hypothetical protein
MKVLNTIGEAIETLFEGSNAPTETKVGLLTRIKKELAELGEYVEHRVERGRDHVANELDKIADGAVVGSVSDRVSDLGQSLVKRITPDQLELFVLPVAKMLLEQVGGEVEELAKLLLTWQKTPISTGLWMV